MSSTRGLGGLLRGDDDAAERDGAGADSDDCGAGASEVGDSEPVADVDAAAVAGACGGADDSPVEVTVTRLMCGTVEKSPGLLSMIAAAPAATSTAEARPIISPRLRGLRQNGGGGGGFFFMNQFAG